MRVILDFQACQSDSRYRGIGRGSRSLMLEMANNLMLRGHDVVCLLSEAFQDGLAALKEDIIKHAPGVSLASFGFPTPCAAAWSENSWRQMAARILREHAIACLEPDFVHVPALLADGWGDDAVGSIGVLGVHIPTSLTQHDLIPLVMADMYMPAGGFRDYYLAKLDDVKQADLFLAISEYSRQEAVTWLNVRPEDVINISSAADSIFTREESNTPKTNDLFKRYLLKHGFLLYVPGGFDPRKNIDRLLEAYALLPSEVRRKHQLVIASKLDEGRAAELKEKYENLGISDSDIVLTDYVSDDDLIFLYQTCHVYIFPSLHEGFGLPALEAMMCGAPVISSNCTSIPEVIGLEDALFDPYDKKSIANKVVEVISDESFRQRLIEHSKHRPANFSWKKSAKIAVDALEQKNYKLNCSGWDKVKKSELPSCDNMLDKLAVLVPTVLPDEYEISVFKACYQSNLGLKI